MSAKPLLLPMDGRGVDVVIQRPTREKTSIGTRVTGGLGSAIDSAISIVAPGYAYKRAMARAMYRSIAAADKSRLTEHRIPSLRDADSELQNKQSRLRWSAREEVRNNAIAKNLKRTHKNNTIGDADTGQGVTVDPAVLKPDGTPDVEVNRQLKQLWAKYRDRLEFTGRWGFTDMLTLNDGELCEAGEALGIFHDRPAPGSDLPFSVELIEADRLPMDTDMFLSGVTLSPGTEFMIAGANGMPRLGADNKPEKHFIKHGIEYDDKKQIVAFHILECHPGSFHPRTLHTLQTRRIEASKVFHYFDPERAEQTRGMSKFISCLPLMADLRDLIEWELMAAKQQAVFGIHFGGGGVPNLPYPNGTSNPPVDANGNPIAQLQPGMVTVGGEQATFYAGNRPGGTFLPFFQSLVRLAGAAFGIGYSATAKDYSQGAYSALRQEDNEDGRAYQSSQGLHTRHFIRPVWRRFVRACALKGLIDTAAYMKDPSRFERCEVNVPGRKHINPLQEITAEAVAVKNGFKDLDEVINVSGKEPEDRIAKLGEQKKLAESAGLELGWMTGEIKPPNNQKLNTTDPDKEPTGDEEPEEAERKFARA